MRGGATREHVRAVLAAILFCVLAVVASAQPIQSSEPSPQQSDPREPRDKAGTPKGDQREADGLQSPRLPLPLWFFEKPPSQVINVFAGKGTENPEKCPDYQGWTQILPFGWC